MKRHTQKQVLHLLAGLLTVFIAFRFFEREDLLQATILFGAGCCYLILAGAHAWIEKNIKKISSYFFFLEAVTFYYGANHYASISDKQSYIVFAIASGLFIALGIFYMIEKKKKRRSTSRRRVKSTTEV